MLKIDPATKTITCPQGDTGLVTISFTDTEGNALVESYSGVAIFAVCHKVGNDYVTDNSMTVTIVNNTATFLISNAFSRLIPQGTYYWDVRIVTDPEYSDDGDVICSDNTDEVHSVYAGSHEGMPKYIVPGVAKSV